MKSLLCGLLVQILIAGSLYFSLKKDIPMERRAKLARLNDFVRTKPACSASAMAAILKDVKQNGLPDLIDRNAIREARNDFVNEPTDYGPILDSITCICKDGEPYEVPLANPFAMLAE